ncbi:hypothetical protein KHU12_26175, partial [Pseudocitrobacter faecalis]|uniref:RNA polymerase sigma factor region1.1 domain-containing protein n=1 Tax=Pseudocitrobacter faecalis TaxID=1398493 RepID=UPI003314833E
AEVNDHLPEDIVDSDQIEDIIQMINDMGIQVMEEAPDADDLLTREGEIDIAKRIEDGINQVQCSVAEYPEAITYLLEQYDRV